MLHLTNGDAAAERLRRAGLPGDVIVWADVLHDGPVPGGLSEDEWRAVRVGFLADSGYADADEARAHYERWDADLASAAGHDELVLWFEHDLLDQLLLVRHLHWLSAQERRPRGVTLVCIDRHPAVPRFRGLGELQPAQLAALFPAREPVSATQFDTAERAWRAFTSPDPTSIERLLSSTCDALPFLAPALARHLEEFPSTINGLSLTEQRALGAVSDVPRPAVEVFTAVQEQEDRLFLGDCQFLSRLDTLSRMPYPLVSTWEMPGGPDRRSGAGPWRLRDAVVQLTRLGHQVLSGAADRVAWTGIDRWLGGVHLQGDEIWRWDGLERRLRRTGARR